MDILQYDVTIYWTPSIPKYLIQVVLVGNAGVGKTCLVRRFTQVKFYLKLRVKYAQEYIYFWVNIIFSLKKIIEKLSIETERQRDREKQRDRETERNREKQRDRETKRQRDRNRNKRVKNQTNDLTVPYFSFYKASFGNIFFILKAHIKSPCCETVKGKQMSLRS